METKAGRKNCQATISCISQSCTLTRKIQTCTMMEKVAGTKIAGREGKKHVCRQSLRKRTGIASSSHLFSLARKNMLSCLSFTRSLQEEEVREKYGY